MRMGEGQTQARAKGTISVCSSLNLKVLCLILSEDSEHSALPPIQKGLQKADSWDSRPGASKGVYWGSGWNGQSPGPELTRLITVLS